MNEFYKPFKGMYLLGKIDGLDMAEFYLRNIHPTQNEAEKELLREAAERIRKRKLVAEQNRQDLLAKEPA